MNLTGPGRAGQRVFRRNVLAKLRRKMPPTPHQLAGLYICVVLPVSIDHCPQRASHMSPSNPVNQVADSVPAVITRRQRPPRPRTAHAVLAVSNIVGPLSMQTSPVYCRSAGTAEAESTIPFFDGGGSGLKWHRPIVVVERQV